MDYVTPVDGNDGQFFFQRAPTGMEAAATTLQLRFETAVLDQKKLHNLACKGK